MQSLLAAMKPRLNAAPDLVDLASAIAGVKVPVSGLSSALHASAECRAHLVGVLAQRAVTAAR
jgi:hypothetical protein